MSSATYNGFVLDYASPVQLNFNFDSNTFNGNFGTANGFNGFEIDGAVKGVNFSAADAGKEVVGSFFNAGCNASGAVNNGTQLGVFSDGSMQVLRWRLRGDNKHKLVGMLLHYR